jgi:hypothetical protein
MATISKYEPEMDLIQRHLIHSSEFRSMSREADHDDSAQSPARDFVRPRRQDVSRSADRRRYESSGEDVMNHSAVNVGQAEIASRIAICQTLVVQAE